MMKTSIDIEQLRSEREKLRRSLERVKKEIDAARKQSAQRSFPNDLGIKKKVIEAQLERIDKQIEAFVAAESAAEKVEAIAENVADELQNLHILDTNFNQVESLKKRVSELTEISNTAIQQLKSLFISSGIEPKLSVIRPNVRLVDANLAYKYADLQSDTSIFIGCTTLFIGTAISAGIGLGVSLSTNAPVASISIYATVACMSMLVSFIFGYLTWQSRKKSNEVKRLLEANSDEKEVALRLATGAY